MNVIVTGGTGFIGKKLVRTLAHRGDTVCVLTRGASVKEGDGRVRFLSWTPQEKGPWMSAIEDADAIVHLAGASVLDERWSKERLEVLRASRVDSTHLVALAAAESKKRPTLVSASAIGIYGMRKDDEALAEDGGHGTDVLASICEAWEAAADPAREAGVRVVHPRIGLALGGDGGALAKMIPPFRAFVGGPIGDGEQWFSWIHWKDVVSALVRAIDDATFVGPLNVTAPRPVRMNELARELGIAMHRPSILRVPAAALKLALGERAQAVLTGPRVIPKKLQDAGFDFAFPGLPEALADILAEL